LDVRNFSEVTNINRETTTVTVKQVKTGAVYEESFDYLVLSPGAKPIVIPTPGLENATNVFTLRNIPDTDRIKTFIEETRPKTAVVIGGGFIGIEMAENLTEAGITVSVIDLANQILTPLDVEMAKMAQNEMETHGVSFYLSDVVSSFSDSGKTVTLKSGKVLSADLVIMGVGVKPENELAVKANLKVGPRGHIVTTSSMQTKDAKTDAVVDNIYAIGDAVEVSDLIDNTPTAIALAWPANRQGRLVADHISGRTTHYVGSLGSSIVKVFDLILASTGHNEKILNRKGVTYKSIYVSRGNHAGYYPGARDIFLK
jgi:NADPH-dependent 2,4-dienoyl-CoA reductase/sulfur reductase-like enzyme